MQNQITATLDRRPKALFWAILLSILFHLLLIWLIDQKSWLTLSMPVSKKTEPEELTFIFPENKPQLKPDALKQFEVVDNMNADNQRPEQSDLLSDRDSRAHNPELTQRHSQSVIRSEGNSPLRELSGQSRSGTFRASPAKKFSAKALTGESSEAARSFAESDNEASEFSEAQSEGRNQAFNQKNFSVEEVGALSLSTYKWEWAPYINAMKSKLYRVWFAPAAYYELGLIHGVTIIRYTIGRGGHLVEWETLNHDGHESLKISSEEAIKALFPFLPLPENFPDETLTITAKLIYPDLRAGR
jgi:hypothetical protein